MDSSEDIEGDEGFRRREKGFRVQDFRAWLTCMDIIIRAAREF
jgi:hypothetical protein